MKIKKTQTKARKLLALATVALAVGAQPAIAGSVAGTGGGTEVTQILNNLQLIQQYEQQVQQFATQGLQLDAQLKNLMKNPGSAMGTDTSRMIQQIGGIMSAQNSMGGSLAQIDRNFAATFNSPAAASYGEKFSGWTTKSKGTLQSSLQAAGTHRDQYKTDTDAVQALYNESQAADGNLGALQTLAKINVRQIQQTQALGDLMATQSIASSTYMAAREAKDQAVIDNDQIIQNAFIASKPENIPATDTNRRTYKKWNLYSPK
jgi:P-type conjugative transfer protein TrbJ